MLACSGKSGNDNIPASPQATALPRPRLEVPDASVDVRREAIFAKDTDPAIDVAAADPHLIFFPVGSVRGLLFVFFHSTNNPTSDYQLISDQAARNGFHAINLRYASVGYDVWTICGPEPAPECSGSVRQVQFDGAGGWPKVDINRANSIENRLLKVLRYLDTHFPNDGWNAYWDGLAPRWSSIVVAGHSQGANIAPFIAKERVVARVASFSGPGDYLGPPGRQPIAYPPAPWLQAEHRTPANRYYAFAHSADTNYNLDAEWKEWKLGLYEMGGIANVDELAPPYGGAHLLLTNALQPTPKKPVILNHGTVIRDDVVPLNPNGLPVFAPVWQYMCFA